MCEESVQPGEFGAAIRRGSGRRGNRRPASKRPGLGFNTGCDTEGTDCGDSVKSTEWTGIAGADVAIYVGSISLWADGRYNFGLSDINNISDVTGDLKNRNWTFQGGVAFAL